MITSHQLTLLLYNLSEFVRHSVPDKQLRKPDYSYKEVSTIFRSIHNEIDRIMEEEIVGDYD